MSASATLPSLLETVLGGLERTYIDEGAGRDGIPSLDYWANLLRGVGDAGTDRWALPAILRLSKRAVRSRVASAARQGWVEEQKLGRGQALVRRTARGAELAVRWESLQIDAEERWRTKTGINRARKLRDSLEEIVSALPLEHPHYPASYGAADASITGGNGKDWSPVPRGNDDTVSDLPIYALVSQSLVAFAMNYEEKSPVALSLSTAVIQRIPADGRPLRGLGHPAGIAALVRHGFVRVSGNEGSEIVHLTRKGFAVSSAYNERIQAVERDWRNMLGDESVTRLRRALEDVSGPEVMGP